MEAAGIILLVFFLTLGFFSIFFGLPGTWVILIAAGLYGWVTGFQKVSLALLLVLTLVALTAELVEHVLGFRGARRFGASRHGAWASVMGGILGAFIGAPVLFGLGALAGLFIGAFVGAFVYEFLKHRNVSRSVRSGFGALLGRFSGTMMKLMLALAMIAAVIVALV